MERIGVIFGGPSPEHDISILTGLQACLALRKEGREAQGIYWTKSGTFHLVDSQLSPASFLQGPPPKSAPIALRTGEAGGFYSLGGSAFAKAKLIELDVIVNCCHGGPGEDGSLQGSFDLAHLRYTGPTARGAALGMDKLAFEGAIRATGVPTLKRVLLTPSLESPGFDGPYIVKPRFGGSSIGIDVVGDFETAKMRLAANVHLRAGAVLEPYRPDLFDLQVAGRTWPTLTWSALEKPLRSGVGSDILSYGEKYIPGEGMATAPRELPAVVPEDLRERVLRYADTVAEVLGVRGCFRIDFLASESGELYVNEINTIPGSLAHYLWIEPKISLGRQLLGLVEEAREVSSSIPLTAGADGSALRSAGSVAAKLA
jgi:D-alanine-D-alanine ligase